MQPPGSKDPPPNRLQEGESANTKVEAKASARLQMQLQNPHNKSEGSNEQDTSLWIRRSPTTERKKPHTARRHCTAKRQTQSRVPKDRLKRRLNVTLTLQSNGHEAKASPLGPQLRAIPKGAPNDLRVHPRQRSIKGLRWQGCELDVIQHGPQRQRGV